MYIYLVNQGHHRRPLIGPNAKCLMSDCQLYRPTVGLHTTLYTDGCLQCFIQSFQTAAYPVGNRIDGRTLTRPEANFQIWEILRVLKFCGGKFPNGSG
jgi:hypothetical protein